MLAQDAFTQYSALLDDALFEFRRGAIPRTTGLAIRKLSAIQPLALRSMHPQPHGTRIDSKLGSHPMHTLAQPDQPNHLTTSTLSAAFLAMTITKKPKIYFKLLDER